MDLFNFNHSGYSKEMIFLVSEIISEIEDEVEIDSQTLEDLYQVSIFIFRYFSKTIQLKDIATRRVRQFEADIELLKSEVEVGHQTPCTESCVINVRKSRLNLERTASEADTELERRLASLEAYNLLNKKVISMISSEV